METAFKIFLGFIITILVFNVLWLDSRVVGDIKQQLNARVTKIEEQVNFLAYTREDQLSATGAEASKSGETASEVKVTPVPAVRKATRSQQSIGTEEVFMTLGSGSTNSMEWVDTGAQVYIDTTIYPNLKRAYFLASLRGNSGIAFARLMQKNEGAMVPGSEITFNTPASTLISSGEILLSKGNKLYTVQLKSETGQTVWVENARVRLVLQ